VSELVKRIAFAVVAAPAAIAIIWFGGAALAALLAIIAALGAWELFRIARAGGVPALDTVGITLAALVPLAVHAHYLRLFTVPMGVLRAIARLGPVASRLPGQVPNFAELVSAADGVTYWASSAKASLKLGYTPRDLEAGIRDSFTGHS
jgi:CDP-diglyceride synthetase